MKLMTRWAEANCKNNSMILNIYKKYFLFKGEAIHFPQPDLFLCSVIYSFE